MHPGKKISISFHVEKKRDNLSLGLTMNQLSYVVNLLLSYRSFVENGGDLMKIPDNLKTASQQLKLLRNVISKGVARGMGANG